ncbi:unnamed protein product [Discosporangium mesarthrocarpum]
MEVDSTSTRVHINRTIAKEVNAAVSLRLDKRGRSTHPSKQTAGIASKPTHPQRPTSHPKGKDKARVRAPWLALVLSLRVPVLRKTPILAPSLALVLLTQPKELDRLDPLDLRPPIASRLQDPTSNTNRLLSPDTGEPRRGLPLHPRR